MCYLHSLLHGLLRLGLDRAVLDRSQDRLAVGHVGAVEQEAADHPDEGCGAGDGERGAALVVLGVHVAAEP